MLPFIIVLAVVLSLGLLLFMWDTSRGDGEPQMDPFVWDCFQVVVLAIVLCAGASGIWSCAGGTP